MFDTDHMCGKSVIIHFIRVLFMKNSDLRCSVSPIFTVHNLHEGSMVHDMFVFLPADNAISVCFF